MGGYSEIECYTEKVVLSIPGNLLSNIIISGVPLNIEKAHGIPNKARPEAVRMGAGIIHNIR